MNDDAQKLVILLCCNGSVEQLQELWENTNVDNLLPMRISEPITPNHGSCGCVSQTVMRNSSDEILAMFTTGQCQCVWGDNYINVKISPLFLAIAQGHKEAVNFLLDEMGDADSVVLDHADEFIIRPPTLLMGAITSRRLDVDTKVYFIGLLKKHGAKWVRDAIPRDANYNKSELTEAISNSESHLPVLKALIDCGIDTSYIMGNPQANSVNFAMAYSNQSAAVMLLENGCDPHYIDPKQYNLLHFAAWDDHVTVVEYLIKKRVPHDVRSVDGNTPLALACHGNATRSAQMLLPLGCDVNNADKDEDTPLLYATFNKNYTLVKLLLDKGADPHRVNSFNTSPLWNAVYQADYITIALLLRYFVSVCHSSRGIDQEAGGNYATPVYLKALFPLEVAIKRECLDLACVLIRAGACAPSSTGFWLTSEARRRIQIMFNDSDKWQNANATTKSQIERIKLYLCNPPSLISCCVIFMRNLIRTNSVSVADVDKLEITNSAKNEILLNLEISYLEKIHEKHLKSESDHEHQLDHDDSE